MSINPYFQTAHPVVSSISMINLRLPEYSGTYMSGIGGIPAAGMGVLGDVAKSGPIELKDALKQSQLFFENGSLLMKQTQVIFSRGVLVFFVDRRKHRLDISKLTNPANMVGLPSAISGFERINTTKLADTSTSSILPRDLGDTNASSLHKGTDTELSTSFDLRSVVCAKTAGDVGATTVGSDNVNDLFIGSKAIIQCADSRHSSVYSYDPMNVLTSGSEPVKAVTKTISTIESIKTHGVIFVFAKNDHRRAATRAATRDALIDKVKADAGAAAAGADAAAAGALAGALGGAGGAGGAGGVIL
jgi:hypothetical protein